MTDRIKILYGDNDIAVCVKPCGVLSQKDATGNPGLVEILSSQLNKAVFPVHRLDRPVGGVMVYALNAKAAGKLCGENRFEKEYLAVVSGITDGTGEFNDWLYKDGKKGKSYVVSGGSYAADTEKKRKAVKYAKLSYVRLAEGETEGAPVSLVKIKLFTGRTHQIRVQFSYRGHPVAGDGKYGSRIKRDGIALWSYRIAFTHPVNGKIMDFSVLPDKESFFGFDFDDVR